MLSSEQGIDHAVEAGSKAGERQLRLRDKMARVRTSPLELPQEISQRHLNIAHGHIGIGVTE
jgi:hypothetical protein